MTTCTWKGCSTEATQPQFSKSGELWSNLCDAHAGELSGAIESNYPAAILRSWVLAQGGAKAAAERL